MELDAGPDGHTALAHPAIVNTLAFPNAVSVEASTRRMYPEESTRKCSSPPSMRQ